MKKICLIVCFLIFFPAVALAQEKTLYAIGQEMFTLVEAYAACAARNAECTEEDALVLQADAENSLRDLTLLIKSGRVERMKITAGQARMLRERANTVREQLVHISLFDAPCNWGVIIVSYAISLVAYVIQGIMISFMLGLIFGYVWFAVIGVIVCSLALIPSFAIALGSFVFLAPCLFWWL